MLSFSCASMVAAEFTGDRPVDEEADARYDVATRSALDTLREHHKQPAPESDVKDEVAAMLKTVDMGYSGAPDRQLFKEFFESVAYTDLSFSKFLEARASPAEAVTSAAAIPLLGAGLFVLSSALVNKAYPLKDPAAVARSRFVVALSPNLDQNTHRNLDPNLNPNPVITLLIVSFRLANTVPPLPSFWSDCLPDPASRQSSGQRPS